MGHVSLLKWFLIRGSVLMDNWYDSDNYPDCYRVIKPTIKGQTDNMTTIQWLLDFYYAIRT